MAQLDNVVNLTEMDSTNSPAVGYALWAYVSANDDKGLIIDGIEKGDTFHIENASGIASFDKTSLDFVAGIIAVANAITKTGLEVLTEGSSTVFNGVFDEAAKTLEQQFSGKEIKHCRRDAYGQDPGTDDYAKNEGGLIICMPKAHGALYATDGNRFQNNDVHDKGRLTKYYSKNVKNMNSFFPCTRSGGQMKGVADTDGSINILSFDQNFEDNCGYYELKISVVRGGNDVAAIRTSMEDKGWF
ncbi:MAG: hypothetical protein GY710_15980 [Desulfobacteraceae bacterium]|nr:hypothetical protein [Desulfobacteraceae bacterium]